MLKRPFVCDMRGGSAGYSGIQGGRVHCLYNSFTQKILKRLFVGETWEDCSAHSLWSS